MASELLDDGQQVIVPQLPRAWFNMIDQESNEDGPFLASDFIIEPETNVVYAQTEGRPIILRTVKQIGNTITSIDGEGNRWNYLMIPVQAPDADSGSSSS